MNCYVIKNRNVSFFLRFAVNKLQCTVGHYVAFVQPSYAVPFTQTKLAGEAFSPILFEGKGAGHRLVTMEQMYKSVCDSSNSPSSQLASYYY